MPCPKATRCDVRDPKVGDLIIIMRARIGIPTGTIALVTQFLPTQVVEIRLMGADFKGRDSQLYMKTDVKIL